MLTRRICSLALGLLFIHSTFVNAALQSMSEDEMSEVDGAGIGLSLSNIQVLAEPSSVLEVDNDLDTSAAYLSHVRLFNYDSSNDGATISDSNGISWGSGTDPFVLDVLTDSVTQVDGSTGDTSYIHFRFPSNDITNTNYRVQINNGDFNQAAVDCASTSGSGTNLGDCREVSRITPYQCDGSTDCATLRFRARVDVFRQRFTDSDGDNRKDTSESYILSGGQPTYILNAPINSSGNTDTGGNGFGFLGRTTAWVEAAGLNLFGTEARIWSDTNRGFSAAISLIAHIDELRATTSTNSNVSSYSGSNVSVNHNSQFIYTASTDQINTLFPYAEDDTPNFNDRAQLVTLEGVDIELHLGHLAYQPLNISLGVTPGASTAPTGGSGAGATVQQDIGQTGLLLELTAINDSTYEEFYQEPKSHISIDSLSIGADAAGNCIDPNDALCSFGGVTVEGLQIQYLRFQTQELNSLTSSHCPGSGFTGGQAWQCSFL